MAALTSQFRLLYGTDTSQFRPLYDTDGGYEDKYRQLQNALVPRVMPVEQEKQPTVVTPNKTLLLLKGV